MEHFGSFSLSERLQVIGQHRLIAGWPVLFLPILIWEDVLIIPLVTIGRRGDNLKIITFLVQGGDILWIIPLLVIAILIVRRKEVNWTHLMVRIRTEGTALKITQSVLEGAVAWMLQWRLQLYNSSIHPMSTISVNKFPVYHSGLSLGGSVQVNHRHTLFVGSYHPRLYNLTPN